MKSQLFLLVVVFVTLGRILIGCTNPVETDLTPSDEPGNGSDESGDDQGTPLSIEVTLSSVMGSATIDVQGGEIELTDGMGTVITLSIPEGAVYDEEISMTLISSLGGATLSGGILAGVDIHPDGLQLMKPGTLTITPSDPATIDELFSSDSEYLLTGFAYRGGGSEFHYYPYRIATDGAQKKLVMTIAGFSGYGGGKSNQGDRQTQSQNPPSDPRDKASQEIAEILTEEARQQSQDPDYEPPDEHQEELTAILRRWLYELVIPMAEEAETNENILHCAVMEWLTWEAQAQLLAVITGDSNPFAAEVSTIASHIRNGYENAMAKSHQKAVDGNDSSQINHVLVLEMESQMLGFDIDATAILQRIRRYELEFDSHISESEGNFTVHVQTEPIALPFSSEEFRYAGTGALDHTYFDHVCMIDHTLMSGVFLADTPDIPAPQATRPSCDGKAMPKPPKTPASDIYLFIVPGPTMEFATIQCEDIEEPVTAGPFIWFGSFGYLHEDIFNENDGSFVISGWDITYAQPYATRTFSNNADPLIEHTELTLWYAPLP